MDSILAQDFGDYMPAYILIDNGSSDGTGKIIDEYAKKHDWIVPVHHEANLRGHFLQRCPKPWRHIRARDISSVLTPTTRIARTF